MFGPISAVAFDFDGTLVDTMGNVKLGISKGIEHATGSPVDDEALFKTFGAAPQDVFRRWMAEELVPKAMEYWLNFELQLTPHDIRPFPEVVELLEALKEQKTPIAIFTGRDRPSTLRILKAHGWLDKFFTEEKIFCGDDGIPTKPAPDALWAIAKCLNVPIEKILMVGDHPHDARSAVAAGAKSAAALWDLPPGRGSDRSRFREAWTRWEGVEVDLRLVNPLSLKTWLCR